MLWFSGPRLLPLTSIPLQAAISQNIAVALIPRELPFPLIPGHYCSYQGSISNFQYLPLFQIFLWFVMSTFCGLWLLQIEIHLGSCCNGSTSQCSEGWRRKRISYHQQEKSQPYQEPCRKSSSVTHKASKTKKTTDIGMASENPAPGMLWDIRQSMANHHNQQDPRSWGSQPRDTSAPHSVELKN